MYALPKRTPAPPPTAPKPPAKHDYVSVRVAGKIVAGLVEEVDPQTQTAKVRVRSSSASSKNKKKQDVVSVPVSDVLPLGVHTPATPTAASSAAKQKQQFLSPTVGESFAGASEHAAPAAVKNISNINTNELHTSKLGLYQHGLISKYVYEAFSPIVLLLRGEKPLFALGLLLLLIVAEMCRTQPEVVAEKSCHVVRHVLRAAAAPDAFGAANFLKSAAIMLDPRLTQKNRTSLSSLAILCETQQPPTMMKKKNAKPNKQQQQQQQRRRQGALESFTARLALCCYVVCATLVVSLSSNCHLMGIGSVSAQGDDDSILFDERPTYYLLSDCEDDDDSENDNKGIEQQQKQQHRRHRALRNQRTVREIRRLEVDVYFPDVALLDALREFRGALFFHAFVILAWCLCKLAFVVVLPPAAAAATSADQKAQVMYSHAYIKTALLPVESHIISAAALMREMAPPTVGLWLLTSLVINCVIGMIKRLFV